MGPRSITCHPAEVTFQPLPRPKLALDLATQEGCKAELLLLLLFKKNIIIIIIFCITLGSKDPEG